MIQMILRYNRIFLASVVAEKRSTFRTASIASIIRVTWGIPMALTDSATQDSLSADVTLHKSRWRQFKLEGTNIKYDKGRCVKCNGRQLHYSKIDQNPVTERKRVGG